MERKINQIETSCSCGCTTLKIVKNENYTDKEIEENNLDKDIQYDYSFIFLVDKFTSKQEGVFSIIKRRLKLAWYAIRGKEYLLEDMVFTQKQINELIKELQEISK